MASALIHLNMVGNGTLGDARRPTLILPGIENFTALRASDVYCSGLDGVPIRRDPAGWIVQTVRDCGSVAIVELEVEPQFWELVRGSFSSARPMVTGSTLDEFASAVSERRVSLIEALSGTATSAACVSSTSDLVPALEGDLAALENTDPILASIHSWILNRTAGDTTQALPEVFGNDYSDLDHMALSTFREDWNSSAETDPIRVTTRLWELVRMQVLTNGL